jgi:hypothetical protein
MAQAKISAWSGDSSGVHDLSGLLTNTAVDRQRAVEMYTEGSHEALERARSKAIALRGTFTLDVQSVPTTGDMPRMHIGEWMDHRQWSRQ